MPATPTTVSNAADGSVRCEVHRQGARGRRRGERARVRDGARRERPADGVNPVGQGHVQG